MKKPLRILIVEDSEADADLLVMALEESGYEVSFERVDSRPIMNAALDRGTWDAVIADYNVPGFNAVQALQLIKKRKLDIPFLIVSGAVREEVAAEVMKAGAHDYIPKDRLARLFPAIERELKEATVRKLRRQAETQLGEAQERYRTVVENAPIILFAINREGVFTLSEGKGLEAIGLKPGEAVGQSVFKLYREEPAVLDNVLRALAGEVVEACMEIQNGAGAGKVFETRYTPLKDGNGSCAGLIGVATDVTDRKQAEEKLQYLAYHDPLTGLPNRLLFEDRLKVAISHARRHQETLALIFLDLDRFKVINDSLGHSVGDKVLKEVAGRLKARLREEDTVARLGGDEFILLLPQPGRAENVITIAERINEVMKPPFQFVGHELRLTFSMGITLCPNDGTDSETLFKNADVALYRAKEEGRNNYQFHSPSMNTVALERLVLENQLRQALMKEELALFYQPQWEIQTGKIVGMEALLRWRHPTLGLILPSEFIPLAEETALILPVGEWVLKEACLQNRAWEDAGFPPLRIAVNLSARQFQQPNLVQRVFDILKETGLPPSRLELEITESTAMKRAEFTKQILQKFKEIGIQIAIDDFGTGYSSLEYLKKFPIHTLKLDRSFVHEINTNRGDAAIAEAVIALAHSLNMKVLAEGVETEEQLDFLKRRQCDMIQGNLFSPPLPKDEFEKFLGA